MTDALNLETWQLVTDFDGTIELVHVPCDWGARLIYPNPVQALMEIIAEHVCPATGEAPRCVHGEEGRHVVESPSGAGYVCPGPNDQESR